jgi:hypothetical protein
MRRTVLLVVFCIALSVASTSFGRDHWGFSFHSYAPPPPVYYAPAPPPPPVYLYPAPAPPPVYAVPAPAVGYYRPHHHHYRYARPLPPPRVYAPPRSGVSLWLGF